MATPDSAGSPPDAPGGSTSRPPTTSARAAASRTITRTPRSARRASRPAPRAPRRGRRTGATRPPALCPVSWPLPASRTVSEGPSQRASAVRTASARSPTSTCSTVTPASTAARIAAGSSVRGLSSVTTTRSAAGGRGAHGGPLALVAVPARTEDDHEPARGGATQRGDRARHGVGGVGVVDDHERAAGPLGQHHALHPSGDAGQGADPLGQGPGGDLPVAHAHDGGRPRQQEVDRGQGQRGVHGVEGPGHAELEAEHVRPAVGGEGAVQLDGLRAGGMDLHHADAHVRGRAPPPGRTGDRADGEHAQAGLAGQRRHLVAPGVVDRHHGGGGEAAGEQPELGREVRRERAVEVQVVAGEVGEHDEREPGPVDAVLRQGVAGHLGGGGRAAGVDHLPQQRLEDRRLRGGEAARQLLVAHPGADGADEAGRRPQGAQQLVDEGGDGRLPVGAGDPDQGELVGGVAVHVGGDRPRAARAGRR